MSCSLGTGRRPLTILSRREARERKGERGGREGAGREGGRVGGKRGGREEEGRDVREVI